MPSERHPADKLHEELGLGPGGVLASCRYDGLGSGYFGVDERGLVAGVVLADGTLATRRLDGSSHVAVLPCAVRSLERGFSLAVGSELIRVFDLPIEEYGQVVVKLKDAMGARCHLELVREAPARLSEEEVGEDSSLAASRAAPESTSEMDGQAAAEESVDVASVDSQAQMAEFGGAGQDSGPQGGAVQEEVPWYAAVSGPALRAFFHEGIGAAGSPIPAKVQEQDPEVYWKSRLEEAPEAVEPYRRLFRYYYENRDLERAYWFASVLTYFQVAEPLESEIVERYTVRNPIPPGRPIDEGMWQEILVHPETPSWPQTFFGVVSRPFAKSRGRPLKSYGLKPKDKVDLETSGLLVARVFRYVTDALKLRDTELYLSRDAGFELAVANVVEKGRWSSVCVAGRSLLSGRTEKEVTFVLAKYLTYLRPENLVVLLAPDVVQQTMLMLAATKLVRPEIVPDGDEEDVDRMARALAKELDDDKLEKLSQLVDRMVQDQVSVNLADWNRAVQLTSHRVGLLLCQDLATSVRLALTDPIQAKNVDPERVVRELVRFAVDERHSRARRILGLAITS